MADQLWADPKVGDGVEGASEGRNCWSVDSARLGKGAMTYQQS